MGTAVVATYFHANFVSAVSPVVPFGFVAMSLSYTGELMAFPSVLR